MLFNFQFMHPRLYKRRLQGDLCFNINLNQQKIIMKKIVFLFVSVSFLFACNKDRDKSGIFKGPEVQVYGGKAWSAIQLDKSGIPLQLSLVLNDATLNTVPVGGETGTGHSMENNLVIPFHPKAKEATPFQFTYLNWNPNGHEPEQVYTFPHFDIHFYMSTADEVMNYTDMVKIDQKLPAADYVPQHHVAAIGIPMMGKHWVDVTSPELNGTGSFTQTFIYGSYDSKVVFYEPMITLDFLKHTASFERPIPQPAKFKTAGYYPTKMKVKKHDGVTEIILDGFTYRPAS